MKNPVSVNIAFFRVCQGCALGTNELNGTGFDVLKEIAKKKADQQPVRIVLTNYTMPVYRDAAERLCAEHFFDKATEIREVLTVLASTKRNSDGGAVAA